ncbi:hypothetical protein COCNU_scaffold001895G000010 [Cocos nucifera]|nr:hypothetical protein [Cocos nucifera]
MQREEQASIGLKVASIFKEDKRKRAEEEVGAERKHDIEAFKSSKAMEDIKIAFSQEAFLKEFEVYMRRVAKKFSNMILDFLTEEPGDEAGPSNTSASSPIAEPDPETSEPTVATPKLAPETKVAKNVPTSSITVPSKPLVEADPLPQGISLKARIRHLEREVRYTKKKLKKVEDKLQRSRKNYSEATIEVTCLRNLHKKNSMNYINKK